MEYMLTFHIVNVYVDKTQPRQFKFTFKPTREDLYDGRGAMTDTTDLPPGELRGPAFRTSEANMAVCHWTITNGNRIEN